jgi:hypothetical protein
MCLGDFLLEREKQCILAIHLPYMVNKIAGLITKKQA